MLLKNMNVIKCKDRKCCQWGVEALPMPKAPKGSHVFNLYSGPKFVFYLRYPWKLLMQVFINNTAGHPLLTHTRLSCMKKVVLAVRRWLAVRRDVDTAVSASPWEVGRTWWMSLFWDCTAPRRGKRTCYLFTLCSFLLGLKWSRTSLHSVTPSSLDRAKKCIKEHKKKYLFHFWSLSTF